MAALPEISLLPSRVMEFVDGCRVDAGRWAFASTPGGPETLYGSCFACMLFHYLGRLDELSPEQKAEWASYLNSWQDPESGYFLGPELVREEMTSPKHSFEHVAQHLTAHVLPVLDLLDARPQHPLRFAFPFTGLDFLTQWLAQRDWRDAWLEGNNLLFVGQFLIFLRDVERHPAAQAALDLYFAWLDREVDPATGLWGSNGFCSRAAALYGGYHQLLVYYHENRPVLYPQRLIEVALSLQHTDGGFNPRGGGGACEDTDAIDILVNLYKRVDYRRSQVRRALRKAVPHILARQMEDGGFVYRLDEPFRHMGIVKTSSGPNQSNLFPTWFRVHTLALIGEILTDEPLSRLAWRFNGSCSMGWHRPWDKSQHRLTRREKLEERVAALWEEMTLPAWAAGKKLRSLGGKVKRRLLGGTGYA